MARKTTAPVVDPEEDELESLDEIAEDEEGEAAPKPKRARKARTPKEEPEGMTSKEAAAALGITPVKLRRVLRTDDFFNDKGYTRYRLSDEDIARLREAIAAGVGEKRTRTKKAKAAKTEVAAEEVSDELAELLEDLDEDEEDLELDEEEAGEE